MATPNYGDEIEVFIYPDAVGGWVNASKRAGELGPARTSWQVLVDEVKKLRPDSLLDWTSIPVGVGGWIFTRRPGGGESAWLRYEWQRPTFRADYMAAWWWTSSAWSQV